ncbi:thiol:disulfide interchange protein [Rhodoferax saidenbachensis]|uniref:Thiol:disulfide interchange protein n=1 Tax=Rhodoferax saidenbachensis TaxID=1484693 RepID=A0A1P8KFG7_9BURK|nr:thiol:disulfide interchange protein [Rhodoferax saidenbachensis]
MGLTLATAFTLVLGACSPKDEAPAASTSTPAQSYATVAKEGKGFTVGAMMSANTVYVMFDPQCPHCGHLWQASVPLQSKVKFVWVPVSFINAKSAPQGAALLMASNPAEAMTAHETSILAGQGGMSASASVPSEIEDAIKKNTTLFNSMRVESVPYVLAKNQNTGQVVANAGAMDTAGLAAFLGLN